MCNMTKKKSPKPLKIPKTPKRKKSKFTKTHDDITREGKSGGKGFRGNVR